MVIKIEFGKTLDEYMSKFGEAYNNGELWDFDAKEFGDGSIELDPNIVYWKIGDRIYETTVLNIEYNVTSAVKILRESTISRDDLYKEIDRIFGNIDKFLDIVEEGTPNCYISFKYEDEYVVVDSRAHRYISWYKHVGRDFDTDMSSKEEVISFLERLHGNWRKEYEEEGKCK